MLKLYTRIQTILLSLALSLGVLTLAGHAEGVYKIRHPIAAAGSNAFIDYYWDLLAEACRHTEDLYDPCQIEQTEDYMNHLRAMQELANGTINIYVRAFINDEFIDQLDLVAFPLDMGLLGHRIALINQASQAKISTIQTADDLKQFTIGQGQVWLDSDILEAADMHVVRSTSYDGLFPMVASGRIDLFTRGLNEVLGEYKARKDEFPNLAIEKSLVISYPMSFYFIVRQDEEGQKLKERLTLGLNRMLEDGSFHKKFNALLDEVTLGLDVEKRRIIRLPNNFYNRPEYRVDDPTAWVDLKTLK